MRIVIIGNGVAGMEAALAVRKREPTWEITLISEESDHFFSRTALMWVFSGQMSHRDIEPLERDAYERLGFRRVRARAIGIDSVNRRVPLAGGQRSIPYDRLLIASGLDHARGLGPEVTRGGSATSSPCRTSIGMSARSTAGPHGAAVLHEQTRMRA